MKTNALRTWIAAGALVMTTAAAMQVAADQPAAAGKNEKSCTGRIVAVDPKEHVLNVKGFWVNHRLNLGDNCAYVLPDKASGSVQDLRTGQKVKVSYRNVEGVLVADRVEQEPMRWEGTVKAINHESHTMTIRSSMRSREFQIADDCDVLLRNGKSATLAEIQPGERVIVNFETPGGTAIARQISKTSDTFTGSIVAIDLTDRTIKAKGNFGTRKFNLADGCSIVVNGELGAKLQDLRPGAIVTLSFEEVNGVRVANRVAEGDSTPPAVTARAND